MTLMPYNPQKFLRIFGFGLLRFRSPLLTECLLVSSPPGTEMFYFPGCAPALIFGVKTYLTLKIVKLQSNKEQRKERRYFS
jgi:hypothetical protein